MVTCRPSEIHPPVWTEPLHRDRASLGPREGALTYLGVASLQAAMSPSTPPTSGPPDSSVVAAGTLRGGHTPPHTDPLPLIPLQSPVQLSRPRSHPSQTPWDPPTPSTGSWGLLSLAATARGRWMTVSVGEPEGRLGVQEGNRLRLQGDWWPQTLQVPAGSRLQHMACP